MVCILKGRFSCGNLHVDTHLILKSMTALSQDLSAKSISSTTEGEEEDCFWCGYRRNLHWRWCDTFLCAIYIVHVITHEFEIGTKLTCI